MAKTYADKKQEREKDLEKRLKDVLEAFDAKDVNLRKGVKAVKHLLRGLLGDSDIAVTAHEIQDPPPPSTMGLPIKTVIMLNGNGCIELIGSNDTVPTKPLDRVIGRVFRVTDTIPDPPTPDGDPRYIEGTLDQYGMYYQFTNAGGNVIPGALSGGSDNNIVQTWARASGDANWTASLCYRQFVGTVGGSGYGYAGSGSSGSSGGGSSGSGSSGHP